MTCKLCRLEKAKDNGLCERCQNIYDYYSLKLGDEVLVRLIKGWLVADFCEYCEHWNYRCKLGETPLTCAEVEGLI